MKTFGLTLVLILAALGCSKGPRSIVVTEKNKDTFIQEVGAARPELNDEEKRLLAVFYMRSKMGGIFGIPVASPVGKTVGQILDEQKAFEASGKAKAADEERAKKEARARREVKEKELRQSVSVVLFDMTPQKSSFMGGGVTLHLAYENPGTKDVRAFEGRLVLNDILGHEAADLLVKSLTPLKAGEKANAEDSAPFMVYGGLREKKLADLKAEWRPTKIIFVDGSTLNASEGE